MADSSNGDEDTATATISEVVVGSTDAGEATVDSVGGSEEDTVAGSGSTTSAEGTPGASMTVEREVAEYFIDDCVTDAVRNVVPKIESKRLQAR